VGTATLLVEKKIIRSCGRAGHIEDVVVDEACRGQRLGQRRVVPPPPPSLACAHHPPAARGTQPTLCLLEAPLSLLLSL